jgi:mannose-6-phosphate isomerase-like protein (cupin superfamily)
LFFDVDDFEWHEPPGHFGGYSRYLVNPDNAGSQYFDFRVSRYPEGGFVELHKHDIAEQTFLILSGYGEACSGDESRAIHAGMVIFVPAGVMHSIKSTGPNELEFVVVTSPPSDIER